MAFLVYHGHVAPQEARYMLLIDVIDLRNELERLMYRGALFNIVAACSPRMDNRELEIMMDDFQQKSQPSWYESYSDWEFEDNKKRLMKKRLEKEIKELEKNGS